MTTSFYSESSDVHNKCIEQFIKIVKKNHSNMKKESNEILRKCYFENEIIFPKDGIGVNKFVIGRYNTTTQIFQWSNEEINKMVYEFISENYYIDRLLGHGSFMIPRLFSNKIFIKKKDNFVIPLFIRMFINDYCLVKSVQNNIITYIFIDNFRGHINIPYFFKEISNFSYYSNYMFEKYLFDNKYPPLREIYINKKGKSTLLSI